MKLQRSKGAMEQRRESNHLKGGAIAAIDQGVLSSANFVAGLLFIKLSSPEEYGLYVALTSVLLLFSGVQNAVVNSPMAVLLPRIPETDRNTFVASLFVGQGLALGFLGIVLIPFFPFIIRSTLHTNASVLVGVVFGLCTFAFLSRDFVRNLFYVTFRASQSLILDSIYAVLMIILFLGLAHLGKLDAQFGIMMVGMAALVSCTIVYPKVAYVFHAQRNIRNAFNQTWQYSRWAFAGAFASWLQQNTFIYLAAMSLGVSSIAQIAAARLFMVPCSLAVAGWGNYIRPIMSHAARTEGKAKVLSLLKMGGSWLVVLIALYTLVLYFIFSRLSSSILPPSYHEIGGYLVLWGGIGLIDVFGTNLSVAMQSLLLYRDLFLIGVVGTVVSIILGILLAPLYGSIGFLVGVVSSNFVVVLLCLMRIRRN
jgi:O-antigen/teichoic acid export membrane protein